MRIHISGGLLIIECWIFRSPAVVLRKNMELPLQQFDCGWLSFIERYLNIDLRNLLWRSITSLLYSIESPIWCYTTFSIDPLMIPRICHHPFPHSAVRQSITSQWRISKNRCAQGLSIIWPLSVRGERQLPPEVIWDALAARIVRRFRYATYLKWHS